MTAGSPSVVRRDAACNSTASAHNCEATYHWSANCGSASLRLNETKRASGQSNASPKTPRRVRVALCVAVAIANRATASASVDCPKLCRASAPLGAMASSTTHANPHRTKLETTPPLYSANNCYVVTRTYVLILLCSTPTQKKRPLRRRGPSERKTRFELATLTLAT